MSNKTQIQIIYDGECPFCSNFVQMSNLKSNATNDVELISAREDLDLVSKMNAQGYDLNEGMVLIVNGKIYYGADAVYMIQLLSVKGSLLQRTVFLMFRSRKLLRILYPVMKLGRRITLMLLGKGLIK